MDVSQVGYSSSRMTFSLVRSTAPIIGLVEAMRTSLLKDGNYVMTAEPQVIAELLAAQATNVGIAAGYASPPIIKQIFQFTPISSALTDGRYWRLYTLNPSGSAGGV